MAFWKRKDRGHMVRGRQKLNTSNFVPLLSLAPPAVLYYSVPGGVRAIFWQLAVASVRAPWEMFLQERAPKLNWQGLEGVHNEQGFNMSGPFRWSFFISASVTEFRLALILCVYTVNAVTTQSLKGDHHMSRLFPGERHTISGEKVELESR